MWGKACDLPAPTRPSSSGDSTCGQTRVPGGDWGGVGEDGRALPGPGLPGDPTRPLPAGTRRSGPAHMPCRSPSEGRPASLQWAGGNKCNKDESDHNWGLSKHYLCTRGHGYTDMTNRSLLWPLQPFSPQLGGHHLNDYPQQKDMSKCCRYFHFTDEKNQDWQACIQPRNSMASPHSTWCPKPEMSTGIEMQRLSKGAEGASRDVGFTGSPGGDTCSGSCPSERPGLGVGS